MAMSHCQFENLECGERGATNDARRRKSIRKVVKLERGGSGGWLVGWLVGEYRLVVRHATTTTTTIIITNTKTACI
ncbi:hypothetical protein M0802_010323 [Mischocyttarus mexicanus]|nr:hypothetical protein M0802_010323 [Mischocyttarus mexicanus]